jgi:two-component system NtrC family sensor kinase
LREIEGLAVSISKGNFKKIEDIKSNDEIGSVIGAINIMSEELKNRQEEIIQSKKLASLGILTAGVAHELTNPLNNISMVAQNFIEMYDSLSRDQRIGLMDKVEEETKRIEGIVRNLLDFAKPKVADLKEADINNTIRKAVKLMQNTLDISNIELNLSLDPSIQHVFIDEPQIQQVLVNLIVNAIQAMSPGGKLFIKTRACESKSAVIIEVGDNGKGIPPEFLPHIFDPFFSTKGVGGTGLGMSISYGIIKNHKGNIKVESTVDVGTTFTIELPVYKK